MAWVMETRTRLNISRELPQQERVRVIDNIMVTLDNIFFFFFEVKEDKKCSIISNFSFHSISLFNNHEKFIYSGQRRRS